MTDDGVVPQHDPLSDEMDLITFKEADARLYEELMRTRRIIADLEADGNKSGELAAQQKRAAALQTVAKRLRTQQEHQIATD